MTFMPTFLELRLKICSVFVKLSKSLETIFQNNMPISQPTTLEWMLQSIRSSVQFAIKSDIQGESKKKYLQDPTFEIYFINFLNYFGEIWKIILLISLIAVKRILNVWTFWFQDISTCITSLSTAICTSSTWPRIHFMDPSKKFWNSVILSIFWWYCKLSVTSVISSANYNVNFSKDITLVAVVRF